MVLFVPHQRYDYKAVKNCSLDFIKKLPKGKIATTVTFFPTAETCSITPRRVREKEHPGVDSDILNLNNLLHALETFGKEQPVGELRNKFLGVVKVFELNLVNYMNFSSMKKQGYAAKEMADSTLKSLPDGTKPENMPKLNPANNIAAYNTSNPGSRFYRTVNSQPPANKATPATPKTVTRRVGFLRF